MAEFVHVHNHSYYSLLDGMSSPETLAKRAKEMGQTALAITDHGSCAGLYNFQKACQKVDIKPILGMETYMTPDMSINSKEQDAKDSKTWHLVLLAKNKIGYNNLIKLSSLGYLEGFYRKPRIDFNLLQEHKEGLIVSTACCVGELSYYLNNGEKQSALDMVGKYKDVFGDDFYLEVMTHKYFEQSKGQEELERKLANTIYKLSKHTGIHCIATQDSHYDLKKHWDSQDVLLAHQTHNHIKNPDRMSFWSDDFYLKSTEEMEKLYGHTPELLTNTIGLAEKIEDGIIVPDNDLLPYVEMPEGIMSEVDYLKKLVTDGMKRHGLINKPEYRERVKYEVGVLANCGYVRYFLILWDIINFCKNEGIRIGIGRGCFLPESKVFTSNGEKCIKDILKNDEVLSYDGEFHEVLKTMKYAVDEEIIDIDMEDGRVISCTLDHKIHVQKNGTLEWVQAKDLTEEDEIYDINVGNGRGILSDSGKKIKSISRRKYKGDVHDISVEGIHAYNIEGLSVHNSAAASLVLYVLDVVKIDPIKYGLIFERFLNPERVSPPDVDLDFDFDRRSEVHDYFSRKYGADHCCHIGTYQGMKAKASVRNIAKALDIGNDWETFQKAKQSNPDLKAPTTKNSLNMADQISKIIDKTAPPNITLLEAIEKFPELQGVMAKYPLLNKHANVLEGTLASAGVHASGLIAIKNKVIDQIPLKKQKGVISSQYDGPEVEELGLLKFDILGLKTLTVVDKTIKMIHKRTGKLIDIDNLEPEDPKVYTIFNGRHKTMDTKGIFQFESSGMMALLKNMQADRFEDIVVANALYRPGPLKAGVHDMYCDFKHGRKEVEYLHPKMEEALKDTYGVIAYQETVMKLSQVMANYTMGQADILRKAMGKKKQEIMDAQKASFVDGCIKNNIDKQIALKVWDYIDKFAGYGFNKCLAGDTTVRNKLDDKIYTLEELADGSYGINKDNQIVLDSYVEGEIVEDEMVEVFETGEKEIYEVELDNGIVIKCTLDHKFYCSDGKPHTVQEIMDEDLEILYEEK